jgi:uncharacterized protein with HEPN domain
MKSDLVYCEQILDAVGKIHLFVEGIDKEAFLKDQKTQSAVIMQLALIGELAKRVSAETKSAVNVPWKEIAGFRDRAIHDYYQIDLNIAWDTINLDLDPLADALRRHFAQAGS